MNLRGFLSFSFKIRKKLIFLTINEGHSLATKEALKGLFEAEGIEELDLTDNPFTLTDKYRYFVIANLPKLSVLDTRKVTPLERRHAYNIFPQFKKPNTSSAEESKEDFFSTENAEKTTENKDNARGGAGDSSNTFEDLFSTNDNKPADKMAEDIMGSLFGFSMSATLLKQDQNEKLEELEKKPSQMEESQTKLSVSSPSPSPPSTSFSSDYEVIYETVEIAPPKETSKKEENSSSNSSLSSSKEATSKEKSQVEVKKQVLEEFTELFGRKREEGGEGGVGGREDTVFSNDIFVSANNSQNMKTSASISSSPPSQQALVRKKVVSRKKESLDVDSLFGVSEENERREKAKREALLASAKQNSSTPNFEALFEETSPLLLSASQFDTSLFFSSSINSQTSSIEKQELATEQHKTFSPSTSPSTTLTTPTTTVAAVDFDTKSTLAHPSTVSIVNQVEGEMVQTLINEERKVKMNEEEKVKINEEEGRVKMNEVFHYLLYCWKGSYPEEWRGLSLAKVKVKVEDDSSLPVIVFHLSPSQIEILPFSENEDSTFFVCSISAPSSFLYLLFLHKLSPPSSSTSSPNSSSHSTSYTSLLEQTGSKVEEKNLGDLSRFLSCFDVSEHTKHLFLIHNQIYGEQKQQKQEQEQQEEEKSTQITSSSSPLPQSTTLSDILSNTLSTSPKNNKSTENALPSLSSLSASSSSPSSPSTLSASNLLNSLFKDSEEKKEGRRRKEEEKEKKEEEKRRKVEEKRKKSKLEFERQLKKVTDYIPTRFSPLDYDIHLLGLGTLACFQIKVGPQESVFRSISIQKVFTEKASTSVSVKIKKIEKLAPISTSHSNERQVKMEEGRREVKMEEGRKEVLFNLVCNVEDFISIVKGTLHPLRTPQLWSQCVRQEGDPKKITSFLSSFDFNEKSFELFCKKNEFSVRVLMKLIAEMLESFLSRFENFFSKNKSRASHQNPSDSLSFSNPFPQFSSSSSKKADLSLKERSEKIDFTQPALQSKPQHTFQSTPQSIPQQTSKQSNFDEDLFNF